VQVLERLRLLFHQDLQELRLANLRPVLPRPRDRRREVPQERRRQVQRLNKKKWLLVNQSKKKIEKKQS
jgi:hypothetical protein